MSFLDFFRSNKRKDDKQTSQIAKNRLSILLTDDHQRFASLEKKKEILPKLQKDIIEVINKYFPIEVDKVSVDVAQVGNVAVLELNATLPESEKNAQQTTTTS